MKSVWRILAVLSFGLGTAHWLHAAPFAYIAHQAGVTVFDLDTRTIVTEIPANVSGGVAVRRDVNRVYVTDRDKVSVIDMRAQALIATAALPTIGGPIVMRPGRPEAYIVTDHCAASGPCTADLSTVIRTFNTDTNAVGDSFADNATARLEFSPDGLLMFVTRSTDANLSILSTATRQLIATVPLAAAGRGMAVQPSRNLLYVAEYGSSGTGQSVAIVDIASRTLVGRVTVGTGPSELAIAGGRLFVSNTGSNTVSAVDTNTRAVVGTVNVGQRPIGIDATPGGDQVVVANNGSASATIIDTVSLNIVATFGVGPSPTAIGHFIGGSSAPQLPDTLSGLWWNPAEPGWGVHVAHRGNKIFAAWFTYNANGAPKWYVSSDCSMNSQLPTPPATGEATCTGKVYETTGPRFTEPYNPSAVTVKELGLFQMGFRDRDNGAMSFVIGGTVKTMTLKRQVFASGNLPGTDYTDLWWNPGESGWGIGITQQAGTMFLAWFTYDESGAPAWLVASNCVVNATGNACTGDLYHTSGPIDPLHNPFDSSRVTVGKVGSITVSFTDANSATMSYTVDGRAGTKRITRQLF